MRGGATVLSVVGHPFVLVPLMVTVTARSSRIAIGSVAAGALAAWLLGAPAGVVRGFAAAQGRRHAGGRRVGPEQTVL
jgi:hypothetical protein